MVWSYVDYGAEDQTTMDANRGAFDRYAFRRKVLTGNEATDLGVEVGRRRTCPCRCCCRRWARWA